MSYSNPRQALHCSGLAGAEYTANFRIKTSELIISDLWIGLRPGKHHTPGQQGHNSSTYIPYLLTAR
ncbi:hypothetical protein E2C01_030303 [Portunus trituberculatus]|uniref:Uncharacterized protein n=1 Tax=Portunus trituberculatus TaxID=210409 RepID=A0A5B7EUH9_PORTR|nr:hypothetical protein [Portunus trituberculatus]